MPETLQVEDLTFEVRRSAERSTVGLTVDRDGSLVAHAPDDCPTETLESIARQKQVWVHQKLAEKEFLNQSRIEKEYVPGEGFYYLGKTYRLRLVEDEDRPPLQLLKGRFCLQQDERPRAREHFKGWYLEHAQPWLEERVGRFVDRMAVDLDTIAVRDIGYRWGSCNDARVHFHWRVILLPPRIIDYVIVHELAHVHVQNHGEEFWRRVEKVMPDFRDRKRWLAENGARYDC